MGFLNGSVLSVIVVYYYTLIQNPLKEKYVPFGMILLLIDLG